MEWRIRITLVLALIVSAGLCHSTERVVIVLDASVGMWEPFQTGTPRHVAVRDAVGTLIESLTVQQQQLELGLHTIGGRSDITVDFGCEDTDTLVETGPIEPWQWTAALAGAGAGDRKSRRIVHGERRRGPDRGSHVRRRPVSP